MLESNEPKPGSALARDAARSSKTEQPTKRRADALVHRMVSVPEAADYLGVRTSFWLDERTRRNTSESTSVRGRR